MSRIGAPFTEKKSETKIAAANTGWRNKMKGCQRKISRQQLSSTLRQQEYRNLKKNNRWHFEFQRVLYMHVNLLAFGPLLLWHLRPPFTLSQSSPEGLVCCFNLMTCVVPFILLSVVALLAGDVLALCDSLAVVLLQLLRWVSCDDPLLIVYCLYLLALFLVVWSLELDNQNSTSLGRLCVPYGSCTYAPWLHLNSKMWLWTKWSP